MTGQAANHGTVNPDDGNHPFCVRTWVLIWPFGVDALTSRVRALMRGQA